MSTSRKWMVLCLAGPTESWRLAGRKMTKMTYYHPTFSAMVGMVGSALGVHRDDKEMIAEIASSLHMVSFNLTRPADGALLEDLQTVGCRGVADNKSAAPLTAKLDKKGKWLEQRKQLITKRYYLSDAMYFVMLSGPADKIDRYWAAIRRPRYPLYLGTKCCPFSERIDVGLFESEVQAMGVVEAEAKHRGLTYVHRESDVEDVSQANNTLPDYPFQFGLAAGGYGRRPVRDDSLEV